MLPIAVESLTKDFGSVRALDDLSFEIAPGRVVGLLGPNGSGQTTTLPALLGLVGPTRGCAVIGGRAYASEETNGDEGDRRGAHGAVDIRRDESAA